jgi:hypothetical protein
MDGLILLRLQLVARSIYISQTPLEGSLCTGKGTVDLAARGSPLARVSGRPRL